MSKLKKVKLKKEVIANINDDAMSRLWAGQFTVVPQPTMPTGCVENTCPMRECYQPETEPYDDSNHTAVGSDCDAETCGWAYTCNGR